MELEVNTPITDACLAEWNVGDKIYLSGFILCGRDAVLPKIVEQIENGTIGDIPVDLNGSVVFHSAVSPAGVGPTSSNKLEIERSIEPLSKAGVKLHLGKGEIHQETREALEKYHAAYAVVPPVTALLRDKTIEQQLLAFGELGMEAFYQLKVNRYPAIIAAIHGRSIYG